MRRLGSSPINRRAFLASVGLAGATASFGQTPPAGGQPVIRTSMGITTASLWQNRRDKTIYEFLEFCHSRGAGGAQAPFASLDPDYILRVRRRAERWEMYVEIEVELPRGENTEEFERTVKAAKDVGAVAMRAACLGGRRYEEFASLAAWKEFEARSKQRIEKAVPILDRYRVPLGLENHKDWTADELVALLQTYSSEYLGTCLDTGNNLSLLDDPMYAVEKLAPYAVSTHFKDMAVAPYPDGFLLSEVVLGKGLLNLRRMVEVIHQARPQTRFNLEMITRDPLRIPCLTDQYWTTFPDRSGLYLARALRRVRDCQSERPLPRPGLLAVDQRLQLEDENIRRCLAYAAQQLGLAA